MVTRRQLLQRCDDTQQRSRPGDLVFAAIDKHRAGHGGDAVVLCELPQRLERALHSDHAPLCEPAADLGCPAVELGRSNGRHGRRDGRRKCAGGQTTTSAGDSTHPDTRERFGPRQIDGGAVVRRGFSAERGAGHRIAASALAGIWERSANGGSAWRGRVELIYAVAMVVPAAFVSRMPRSVASLTSTAAGVGLTRSARAVPSGFARSLAVACALAGG
jgi:hypothetical protein